MRFLAATLLSVLLAGLALPGCVAAASRLAPFGAGALTGAAGASCDMTCCRLHAPRAACAKGWNCRHRGPSAVAPPLASLPPALPAVAAPLYAARLAPHAALPEPHPLRDLAEQPPRT
jgi:hypothetical protein